MVYVFLADGFEEIEAVTPIDILRRASLEVDTVSTGETYEAVGAHGIRIRCDKMLWEIADDPEMILLPGGSAGVENLGRCAPLIEYLHAFRQKEGYIAAICAAPTLLAREGLLRGKKATCYPSLVGELRDGGAKVQSRKVVVDGDIVTSMGAGTSAEFAFALVRLLAGKETAAALRTAMVY